MSHHERMLLVVENRIMAGVPLPAGVPRTGMEFLFRRSWQGAQAPLALTVHIGLGASVAEGRLQAAQPFDTPVA